MTFELSILHLSRTCTRTDIWSHGTNEKNLSSIRQRGLLPGGTRGGRNRVHFALDSCLTTMVDALRPESGCVIIARPTCLHDLDPVITESNYVLTPYAVPFDRFCGVWSFIDRVWIDVPNTGELFRMTLPCILLTINFFGKREVRMNQMVSHGKEVNTLIMLQLN